MASGLGIGLLLGRIRGSDSGSGTLAAVPALAVGVALHGAGWHAQLAAAMLTVSVSVWAAGPFSRDGDDPGWVVVDEIAGALVSVVGLAGWHALVAWVVFRAADIVKGAFPGVTAAERLPGGWGVTADDLVAGVYGLAAGWVVSAL